MTTLPHPQDLASAPRYTPDSHPNRDVKPDDWMLRNVRQTSANLATITSTIDLTRKGPRR